MTIDHIYAWSPEDINFCTYTLVVNQSDMHLGQATNSKEFYCLEDG